MSIDPEVLGYATQPRADVAIVNWNSGALLRNCIHALASSTVRDHIVVSVVDNGSVDGSCEGLDRFGLSVVVTCNPENRGFGAASNQAAAIGRAPYILILNPDTAVEPDTLERALGFLDNADHASIGVLGVRLTDNTGRTQRTCARAPTPGRLLAQSAGIDKLLRPLVAPHFMTEWDHLASRPVDQVMGAFLLIRRSLFEQLGGFDERFFVYYEDVDLCVRAVEAGAQVFHFADASAWHKGGGTTDQVRDLRLFYFLRSQIQYGAKHFGPAIGLPMLLASLGSNIPIRAAASLVRGSGRDARQVLRAGLLLLGNARSMVSKMVRRENAKAKSAKAVSIAGISEHDLAQAALQRREQRQGD